MWLANAYLANHKLAQTNMTTKVYPSKSLDIDQQTFFLNGHHLQFNHLDWVASKTWISSELSYTLMENGQILAMLSCANENPHVAWVRYFACSQSFHHATAFNILLEGAREGLKSQNISILFALAMHEWVQRLLENESFIFHDEIITMHMDAKSINNLYPPSNSIESPFSFHVIQNEDLEDIYRIDHNAFHPMWQLGKANLTRCLELSNINQIALYQNQAVAYLMSERIFDHQHLSRIAVEPAFQGQQLAGTMIKNLVMDGLAKGTDRFSVNTNRANQISQALYHKIGFRQLDHTLPVYALKTGD